MNNNPRSNVEQSRLKSTMKDQLVILTVQLVKWDMTDNKPIFVYPHNVKE